jgi:hypothetical protein
MPPPYFVFAIGSVYYSSQTLLCNGDKSFYENRNLLKFDDFFLILLIHAHIF